MGERNKERIRVRLRERAGTGANVLVTEAKQSSQCGASGGCGVRGKIVCGLETVDAT